MTPLLRELAPIANVVIATRANSPRSVEPEFIAAEFAKYGVETRVAENVPKAVTGAMKIATDKDLILVTGSLYIVGEAIAHVKGYTAD